MASSAGVAEWSQLDNGAPEIARLGWARLAAVPVAMLGTLRANGSPRISPVEPYLADGRLLIGAMTRSTKAADLRRDSRYVLHSIVTGPDNGEGELKLRGSAVPARPYLLTAVDRAWWSGQPPGLAAVFTLRIATAIFVEWDLQRGMMTIHRWAPHDGYNRDTRRYP
jgi:Pyridoxamine 5'-phosphate oxidase